MYPNLHFALREWFGIDWQWTAIFNSFGLMLAVSFVCAALVLRSEFKRRRLNGSFTTETQKTLYGQPVQTKELIVQFIVGFIIGAKIIGGAISGELVKDAAGYIFSKNGKILPGLIVGAFFVYLKWADKKKEQKKYPTPAIVTEKIWPENRVADFTFLAAIAGLIGAKLFHFLENWSSFIKDPIGNITSPAGLTFYGGLIVAAVALFWYAYTKKINWKHLTDSVAPGLMIAYAVGRLGCQISGDGDWGIYNSAYASTPQGKVVLADTLYNLDKAILLDKKGGATSDFKITHSHFDYDIKEFGKVLHKPFKAPNFLPSWTVAMNYAHNVNEEGWQIKDASEKYQTMLPIPVYPTPLYEFVIGTILFLILWGIRKKITIPGVLFGIYLIMNGAERFLIEQIRVNTRYHFMGISPSQAEIISILLFITGIFVIWYCKKTARKKQTTEI